jgi:hypothetical protein
VIELADQTLSAGDVLTVTVAYQVLESDIVDEAVTNVAVVEGEPPGNLPPVEATDTVTVPINPGETIVLDTGFIRVVKDVEGPESDGRFAFEVVCEDFALGPAGSFTIGPDGGDHEVGVAVPVGTICTVTETRDGGADSTTVQIASGDIVEAHSTRVRVAEGTTKVTFVNTFDIAPIAAPAEPPRRLPATGADISPLLLFAFATLSLGGTLLRTAKVRERGYGAATGTG